MKSRTEQEKEAVVAETLSELPAKESVSGRGIQESADQLCMFRNESDLVNTVLTGWRSSRQVSTDPYISPNKVDQP